MTSAEWQSIILSIQVAVLCSVIATPMAIMIAWWLARTSFKGKDFVESLIMVPMVAPPVVTGYLLLVVFGTKGWIGSFFYDMWGIRIAFSFWALVIAGVVVSLPFAVRTIKSSFEMIDTRLEQAAQTLGATKKETFYSISLPLARPGIISGIILVFARSLGEFGATITFAGNLPEKTQTMALKIFNTMQIPGREGATWRLVVVSLLLASVAIFLSEMYNRRFLKRIR